LFRPKSSLYPPRAEDGPAEHVSGVTLCPAVLGCSLTPDDDNDKSYLGGDDDDGADNCECAMHLAVRE